MIKKVPVILFLACLALTTALAGEGQEAAPPPGCEDCHACSRPAAADPCLDPCPRPHPAETGPEVVLLKALEDAYEAVLFAHGLHAGMADLEEEGCVACHHDTPSGAAHPPCR